MKIYWILIFMILVSCENKNNEIEVYEEYLKLVDEDYNPSYGYVLIPNAGCPGCLSSAEGLAQEYSGSKQIRFVFFQVNSVKTLKIKIGFNIDNVSNFVIDKNNESDKFDFEKFYPTVIYPSEKKVNLISPEFPHTIDDLKFKFNN